MTKISQSSNHFFDAARERRRLEPPQRSQQAAKSLVIATKRPEDAGAHKRRRRLGQSRPERITWQLIYSITTYHLLLFLAIHFVAHTTKCDGQQLHPANGQLNTRDHFNYYFPPVAASNNNNTMNHNHHQRPSHRSQPSAIYHQPSSRQNSVQPKASTRRAPKQTRAETREMAPNHENINQRNAWIPMAATSNRVTRPIEPPVRGELRKPAAARLQSAASSEQHSSANAALLDYPQQPPPVSLPQRQHQQNSRPNREFQSPGGAAANNRARPRQPHTTSVNHNHNHLRNRTREAGAASTGGGRQARGREIQLAQGSHIHQHRNNYPPPPPPMHTSTHHYHHHHHHHFSPPPHRTPRYQQHSSGAELGPFDNELGGAVPEASAKMYKRVLLCDKTLVSLDYIRTLDAEPRPYGPTSHKKPSINFASYHLNDHEIDEITDNILDLDGNFDSSLSRSSSVVAAASSNSTNNATTTSISLDESLQPLKLIDRMTANDTSGASTEIMSVDLAEQETPGSEDGTERRGHASLLSDHDPLVRCDMWDLEKGLKSRKPPAHILRMAIRADFDTVRDAINRCRQLSERTLPPEDEYRGDGSGGGGGTTLELMSTEDLVSLFSMKRGLMPGTKWCGLGDQAETYNDLGPKHRIDICCRAHDHCPIRSKPFRNDYGVLNIGLYTKSHCDCDADFYRCLREVRSRTADMLGNLYFNVMKLQCMREERLKVCRKMKPLALGFERCVRYEDSPVATVFKFTTPPVAY